MFSDICYKCCSKLPIHLDSKDSPSWTRCKSSIPKLRKYRSVVVMDECPKVRWR